MAESAKERIDRQRKERNACLAGMVKRGEVIPALVERSLLFYPPRPVVKKDLGAIRKLHGEAPGEQV